MDQVTQQNAALVEEASAAAQAMAQQAQSLREAVAFFKVHGGRVSVLRANAPRKEPHRTAPKFHASSPANVDKTRQDSSPCRWPAARWSRPAPVARRAGRHSEQALVVGRCCRRESAALVEQGVVTQALQAGIADNLQSNGLRPAIHSRRMVDNTSQILLQPLVKRMRATS
jgi:cell pole-organizing protein PopZ